MWYTAAMGQLSELHKMPQGKVTTTTSQHPQNTFPTFLQPPSHTQEVRGWS